MGGLDAVLLGIYILMWPILCLGVLVVIWAAVVVEFRQARREGDDVV